MKEWEGGSEGRKEGEGVGTGLCTSNITYNVFPYTYTGSCGWFESVLPHDSLLSVH